MAYVIPTEEPEVFAAGDRVQWERRLSDYPASDGWTSLKYYLRGNFAHDTLVITATASGNLYSVDLSPTVTDAYTPGDYVWQAYVEKSGDRKPIGTGRMTVLTNPATQPTMQPFDGRTHARKCLEAIEAVLENRATHDQQRYVLQAVGRSVDKMSIADVLKLRDYYLTEVQAEEAVNNPGKKNIFVRFGCPS